MQERGFLVIEKRRSGRSQKYPNIVCSNTALTHARQCIELGAEEAKVFHKGVWLYTVKAPELETAE